MSVALNINEELNGVELYFGTKPQQETLTVLKSNGFRWSGFKKCWYSKQSEKTMQLANNLVNNNVVTEVATPVEKVAVKKQPKETLSLWDATQWKGIELTQVQKDQDCKEIAKELRTHVRKQFPQVKFSITVPYYGKINFSIKSSPFEEDSIYLKAVKSYCDNLVEAYRVCYDAGDSYSDIPASYNFHFFKADTHWDYTQVEVTEETTNDMKNFDIKLAEFEASEEDRKYAEYLVWKQEQELRDAEYNKRKEEEKKQVEHIYNSVDVVELEETTQYFVTGAEFADLNKNNTLDQYKEEVKSGKYSIENVKVTKEVHFNNLEALENFSNMLLNDFDFLANTGGSFTDDNRINTITDFYNMDEMERESVKWNLYGVAINFNNELQFVVDAQGYNYARYVGLTDNAKVEKSIVVEQVLSDEEIAELKQQADTLEDISVMVIEELDIATTWQNESWNEYKVSMKNKLNEYGFKLTKRIIQRLEVESLKVAMYKLLHEVDGIQDQFDNAGLAQGEKVTLFYISDWGSITTNRIMFNSAEPSKYAQYDNAVKVTFTPEKQRKLHYKHFYSTLLVFKGWHSLPDTVLHHVEERNGMRVTRSKHHSCDNKQYDEILSYFGDMGIKPIINTYKPVF
jgi:hypothetical protein